MPHSLVLFLSLLLSLSTHRLLPKPFDSVGKHILLPQRTSLYSFRALPYVSTVKLSNVENLIFIQNYTPHTQILLIVPILAFTPFFFFQIQDLSRVTHFIYVNVFLVSFNLGPFLNFSLSFMIFLFIDIFKEHVTVGLYNVFQFRFDCLIRFR